MLKCVTETGSHCHSPGGLRGKSSGTILIGGLRGKSTGASGRRGQTSGGGGNTRPTNGAVLLGTSKTGELANGIEGAPALKSEALGPEAPENPAPEREDALAFKTEALGSEALEKGT